MSQRLADRVAVVTGAGTGIGVGIARRLAEEGARVVVSAASSIQGARDLADEIVASGGTALAVQADFRDPTTAIVVVRTAVPTSSAASTSSSTTPATPSTSPSWNPRRTTGRHSSISTSRP